jgi:saccharopine dehydrogenase-like NADP-dependent oxidoreductase
MSSNSKALITIVGALSKQGRSVAHSLLQCGRYRVRALTRRTDSPEARKLASKGAELVNIELDVGQSKELVDAFRDSYGAFLMTPMIVPPATHETELGKQPADAAAEAGVRHIVYSGLEDVEKITGGQKWAPHFTGKAQENPSDSDVLKGFDDRRPGAAAMFKIAVDRPDRRPPIPLT